MRINIIGTSGSGKTTFGKQLAEILDLPFIEMDALFWGPEWTPLADDLFNTQLVDALKEDKWILDGNYSRTMPIKMERVEVVIWLDFSYLRTIRQAIFRAIQRLFSRKELWPGTGNRESLRMLFSKDSIVLWTMTTYRRRKRKILAWMEDPNYQQIRFHRLSSPHAAAEFLEAIKDNPHSIYSKILACE